MHVLMSHSLENLLGGVQPACSRWPSSSSLALCAAFLLGPSAPAHHCPPALHPSGLCTCCSACWSPPITPPRPSEMAPLPGNLSHCVRRASVCIRHHHCLTQPKKGDVQEGPQNKIFNDQTLTSLMIRARIEATCCAGS